MHQTSTSVFVHAALYLLRNCFCHGAADVCQRLAQTSARAALESGDSGGPAPAWLFRDPRHQPDKSAPYSLWTDESPGWPKKGTSVKPGNQPKKGEAGGSAEQPTPSSLQPPRPPPPRSQVRQIKHIRLPESGGTSAREDVYEVYSTSGPPAYYGADGLLLNQRKVEALQSSASEAPAEKESEVIPLVEKTEEVPQSLAKRKKMKFSLAKVVRKAVSKSKAGRGLNDTSGSDVELTESFRKGRKETSLFFRSVKSEQRATDETRLLPSDEESSTPKRSRQPGVHRQRLTEAEHENKFRLRIQDEKRNDNQSKCCCDPALAPASTYYTSSDMPTEMSLTPVPTSEENYVMGLRRSPSPSTSSTSDWSSKESFHQQPVLRDKASQTSFAEDEDTVIENTASNKTLMLELDHHTIPFYGVLTEEEGTVRLKLEQLPKTGSLSCIDERMPVEAPRRFLPTTESKSASTSKMTSFTSSILAEDQNDFRCRVESAERFSPTEPKRRRMDSVLNDLEKIDCGVPNESSADIGLLSDDTEASWRAMSEVCSDGFDAPLPPIPTKENAESVAKLPVCEESRLAPEDNHLNTAQRSLRYDGSETAIEKDCFGEHREVKVEFHEDDFQTCASVADIAKPAVPSQNDNAFGRTYLLKNQFDDATSKNHSEEITHFHQYTEKMGQDETQCPAVRNPSTVTEEDCVRRAEDGGGRSQIEDGIVCGIPKNISSWFTINSKQPNKSQNQYEKLEIGSSIREGLIHSSKHLAIAVPHQKSIQLLYKAKAKQKESSDTMLDDRCVAFQNRCHWKHEESPELKEENTFSEADIGLRGEANFVDINCESKTGNVGEEWVQGDGGSGEKTTKVTNSPDNFHGEQSYILHISSSKSLNNQARDEKAVLKEGNSPQAAEVNFDNNPVIIVACSRKGSIVDHVTLNQDKDRTQSEDGFHQSAIVIGLDRSIERFSVASGVASLGFLCLKDYAETNQKKITDKSSKQRCLVVPTKSKQQADNMSYTTRKKVVLPTRSTKSRRKFSLLRCASSSNQTKAHAGQLKCESGMPSKPSPSDILACRPGTVDTFNIPENRRGTSSSEVANVTMIQEENQGMTRTGSTEGESPYKDPEGMVILKSQQQESARPPEDQRADGDRRESQVIVDQQPKNRIENLAGVGQSNDLQWKNGEKHSVLPDAVKSQQSMGSESAESFENHRSVNKEEKDDVLGEREAEALKPAMISGRGQKMAASVFGLGDNLEMNRDRISESTRQEHSTDAHRSIEASDFKTQMEYKLIEPEDTTFKQIVKNESQRESEESVKVDRQAVSSVERTEPSVVAGHEVSGDRVHDMTEKEENRGRTTSEGNTHPRETSGNQQNRTSESLDSFGGIHEDISAESPIRSNALRWDLPENQLDVRHDCGENPSETEPLSRATTTDQELTTNLPRICTNIKSIPCLGSADWTPTDNSQGSADFQMPSDISCCEGIPDGAYQKCDTQLLNQDASRRAIQSTAQQISCPVLEVPSEIKEAGDCTNLKEDCTVNTEYQVEPDTQKKANADKKLEPHRKSTVFHGTAQESASQTGQYGMEYLERSTLGGEVYSERRPHASSASEHSGASIQTQSLPSTFNLTLETLTKDIRDLGDTRQPTPRSLHKYRTENGFDCGDSDEVQLPFTGDYTRGSDTTIYSQAYGSTIGETLVASRVPMLLDQHRMCKVHILKTVSDSETNIPDIATDGITVHVGLLIGSMGAARDQDTSRIGTQSCLRNIGTVTRIPSTEDEKRNAPGERCHQCLETSTRQEDCEESFGFQSPTLDRRKAPVGDSGDAAEQERCSNCGEVVARSSVYRIGQRSNMSEMGISLSQFTTNVFRGAQGTPCELSSKSSSSYNCPACDCSVNKQTSVEDSSCPKNLDKRRKRRKQSRLDSQSSSFASATSASTDFCIHTSDFESTETRLTSDVTGSSGAYYETPEQSRRTGSRKSFHSFRVRHRGATGRSADT